MPHGVQARKTLSRRWAAQSRAPPGGIEMAYSRMQRRQVRDAFLLGQGTMSALAERFSVRRQTVAAWAEADGWEALRTVIERESNAIAAGVMARELAEINKNLLDTWGTFLQRVRARLTDDEAAPMTAADLDALSRIVSRLQTGQRTALGADVPQELECGRFVVEYQGLSASLEEKEGVDSPANT